MCLSLTHNAGIDRHVGRPRGSKQKLARSALSLPLSSFPPNPRRHRRLRRRRRRLHHRSRYRILSSGASTSVVSPPPGSPPPPWRPQAGPAEVWGPKSRDGVAMAIPMAIRPHPSPIVKDHWRIPQQWYPNAVQKLLARFISWSDLNPGLRYLKCAQARVSCSLCDS